MAESQNKLKITMSSNNLMCMRDVIFTFRIAICNLHINVANHVCLREFIHMENKWGKFMEVFFF